MSPSEMVEVRETLGRIANPILPESSLNETNPMGSHNLGPESCESFGTYAAATEEVPNPSETMKLVVRSPYWGRILKGKTRRNYDNGGGLARSYRVIACQAVLSATEGQYWGCCPHHGKRVLELKEHHFTDHFAGSWDLYMIGTSVAPTYVVHAFLLLPQNQNTIDLNHKLATEGWRYVGTANASVVGLDLEAMLFDILKQNNSLGFRYHHVHLEILMDQVFDRETPRSRKAAIEKARTDRKSDSGSNAGDSFSVSTMPSTIPHVISNDASWISDTTNHSTSAQEGWSGELAPPHSSFPPPSYPMAAWSSEPTVQWYPAAMPSHHPHHLHHHHPAATTIANSHLNPAQQLLHQGYVIGSNTVLPSHLPGGYNPPGFPEHQHNFHHSVHSGFATGNHRHPDQSTIDQYPLDAATSSSHSNEVLPNEHYDDEDGESEHGHGHPADEKDNEEVATASVSETTADDDDAVATSQP